MISQIYKKNRVLFAGNRKYLYKILQKNLEIHFFCLPLQSQTKTTRLRQHSRIAQLVRASDC